MWDNNTLQQVLQSMPKTLEKEHLQKLQMLIEADKYKNQLISGMDLCGTYAPFCYECDKETEFPCAIAYVNYMKTLGMDIELASEKTEETSGVQEPGEEEMTQSEDPKPEKTKIRIAIARKKTLL